MEGLQGLQEAYDRAYDLWTEAGTTYEAGDIRSASDLYAKALEVGLAVVDEVNVEEFIVELCKELIECCNQAQRYDDAAKYGWKTLVRLERKHGETGPDHRRMIIKMRYVLAFGLSGSKSGREFDTDRFEDARSLFGQNIDSLLKDDQEHDQLEETSRKSLLLENREALAAVLFNLAGNSEDEIVAKDFYRQACSLWEEVMYARAGDHATVVQFLKAKDYYGRCLLHQEKYELALAQLLDLRTRLDQLDMHQLQPEVHNDLEQIRQISIISTVDARRALQRLAEKDAVFENSQEQPISNQELLNKATRLTAAMEPKEGSSRTSGGWNFWPSAFRSQTSIPARPNSASPAPVPTAPGTFPLEDGFPAEANVNKSGAITTEDLPARVLHGERATTPLTSPENIQRSRSANGPLNHSSSIAQAAFAPVQASGMHNNNTVSGDARAHFGNSFAQNCKKFPWGTRVKKLILTCS